MYVALYPERRVTIPQIAAAYDISQNHLMKVVHELACAGLIDSARGRSGGIQLARPAETMRLGQIVRAAEGSAPIVECLSASGGACRLTPACKLKQVLVQAFDAFYEHLDQFTLADLVNRPKALASLLGLEHVASSG